MKVFIAGATGVLGRQLVPQLVAKGHEVVGMTRSALKQDLVHSLGARPVVADELERYGRAAEWYLRSRPGLTGMWQISGRSDVSYDRRVALDRQYAQNWSLAADLLIILKTIPAVCLSRGSY